MLPLPDWSAIDLVAFDVDGTLYAQAPLRRRMMTELAFASLRSMTPLRVVSAYRKLREELAEAEITGFEPILLARTAASTNCTVPRIEQIVSEWLERRPLRHIAACRYPGLPELFAALRRHGKIIGILSDYPAKDKLIALNLAASHIVSATDPDVATLKPHPKGLEVLMHKAGVSPARTLLIGDRVERDGAAAQRAGAACLIRSTSPAGAALTIRAYNDAIFHPLLA